MQSPKNSRPYYIICFLVDSGIDENSFQEVYLSEIRSTDENTTRNLFYGINPESAAIIKSQKDALKLSKRIKALLEKEQEISNTNPFFAKSCEVYCRPVRTKIKKGIRTFSFFIPDEEADNIVMIAKL